LDFDEVKFETTFQEALLQNGIEGATVNVIYPYQERIGVLWLTDHVIPAQEHFTSSLINRKILLAIDQLNNQPKPNCKHILLFAPEKEHHEIPLLFLQYLLKKNGHKVIYFGVNAKVEHLKIYVDQKPVSHLHFNLITNLTSQSVEDYIRVLVANFPGVQISISGPLANEVTEHFDNVRSLKTREGVMTFIEE
jgi:hypothetical protein